MKFTGERIIPWCADVPPGLVVDHVLRYQWVMAYAAKRTVVDLGCGTGYGAYMLSWVAKQVIGLDIDKEAIDFARKHFPGVEYRWVDLETIPFLPRAEMYVAFEVLEHLEHPQCLVDGIHGGFAWSLPVDSPSEFHEHVFTQEQAEAFVPGTELWHQYAVDTGLILPKQDWFPDLDVKYVLGVGNVG